MNKKIGPLSLGGADEEVFLGKDFSRIRNFSEQTALAIDDEIRDLVLQAEETAAELLRSNEERLHTLAAALLRYEVLDDTEIDTILAGKPLESTRNERQIRSGRGCRSRIARRATSGCFPR